MKILLTILLSLLSLAASAQTASFSTATLRLRIPHLVVNRATAFEDVEFLFDAQGNVFELVDFAKRPQELNEQRQIVLAFGESAAIDTTISITFRGVFSDNRCPSDVTCITAGEGVAIFELDELLGSGLSRQTLFGLSFNGMVPGDLTDRETPAHEFRGIHFTPLVLEPYPVSTATIADDEYSVTILASAITSSCFPDGC